MFGWLGRVVVRAWPVILAGWLLLLGVAKYVAPEWDDVVDHGEFNFLPDDEPSRIGVRLFRDSWDDSLASRVVIVVSRKDPEQELTGDDKRFIDEILKPQLEKIASDAGGLAYDEVESGPTATGPRSIIARVRTFKDRSIGRLLDSTDKKASLVIVELTTEFLNRKNKPMIKRIEALISTDNPARPGDIWQEEVWRESELSRTEIRQRLKLSASGDATVGRDMLQASDDSAEATTLWTVVLVMILLVALYRAPVVAMIPLLTVFVAKEIALALLAIAARFDLVGLFAGIEVYVTVLSYGAGVDYCFFLIARYREELGEGTGWVGDGESVPATTPTAPVAESLRRVGAALTASAGTVMCGIGMMVFAEFGKFRQAGIAITFGLAVVLAAALTFTPSLLCLAGRWAFWPRRGGAGRGGWVAATSPLARWLAGNPVQAAWERLVRLLLARPGTIWLASVAVLLPFAAWGVLNYTTLSYGLLSELSPDKTSVKGAAEVQAHFPAGNTGPVTLILRNEQVDFGSKTGRAAIKALTDVLNKHHDSLDIADVRSLTHPYGFDGGSGLTGSVIERRLRRRRIRDHYVCSKEDLDGLLTRIDVVFRDDPFSRDSIKQLDRLQEHIEYVIQASAGDVLNGEVIQVSEEQRSDIRGITWPSKGEGALYAIGPTASIRDLKHVTDRDQVRVDLLVLAGVYAILVILLRRPAISLYLIIGVFFSYLAALGVTFVVFEHIWPSGDALFGGLDWKVPMFLFTILIAVGEDYNIFLMTRIEEEQRRHGLVQGVAEALLKTGSVIAGCGVIMAGTFCSLLAGSLAGMQQLGFALAFGVLLDTMVVMPILVPAWLIMLYRGRFGAVGRWLGAPKDVAE